MFTQPKASANDTGSIGCKLLDGQTVRPILIAYLNQVLTDFYSMWGPIALLTFALTAILEVASPLIYGGDTRPPLLLLTIPSFGGAVIFCVYGVYAVKRCVARFGPTANSDQDQDQDQGGAAQRGDDQNV